MSLSIGEDEYNWSVCKCGIGFGEPGHIEAIANVTTTKNGGGHCGIDTDMEMDIEMDECPSS